MTADPQQGRLARALTLMIEEYADATEALARADEARAKAAARRISLRRAADPLIEALPGGVTSPEAECIREIDRAYRVARARPATGRRAGMLDFLLDWTDFEIRPKDLRLWLLHRGKEATHKYCGNVMSELTRTGHLDRLSHGIYRINRSHDDFITMQLAELRG